MARDRWRQLANAQAGLLTRLQLASLGIDRWAIRHRVRTDRWTELTPTVISTTTGALGRDQLMWLGVLHGGRDAMVGELTAAEGPEVLLEWIDRMRPLRGAARFRTALGEIAGGAQSVAEIDVRRMCRDFGLALPSRQVKRRDADGRLRFTDCEWRLPAGRILVLEVDGGFHREVEHWEDDLARQRALTAAHRLVIRCTARELRDEPERIARDLRALGVPAA